MCMEASLKEREGGLAERDARIQGLQDDISALERQLADQQSSHRKEASALEAQLKQCKEALDSERTQTTFLRQQVMPACSPCTLDPWIHFA